MDRLEWLGQKLVERLAREAEESAVREGPTPHEGGCLTSDRLEAFLRGALDEQTRDRVDRHLDACLPCLNALVEMRDYLHGLAKPQHATPSLTAKLREFTGAAREPWSLRIRAQTRSVLSFRVPIVWPAAATMAAAWLAWLVFLPANRADMKLASPTLSSTLPPTIVTEFSDGSCTESAPTMPLPSQKKVVAGSSRKGDLADLVENVQSGVVVVIALEKEKPAKCGSGFFVDRNGLLLTSYHIVKDMRAVSVKLSNGAFFQIEQVVSIDPKKDLAALKVAGRNLPALKLGDSNTVRAGDEVVAVGNPLGLEASVSTGIISAVRREDDRVLLQTTAPISPGSSGGPLLNAKGEVIGIIVRSAKEGQNLNFAIPINEAKAMQARGASGSNAERALNAYFAGILFSNNKNYERAKESLLTATSLDPTNVDAWLELGAAYYYTGERDKEGAAYKKAVEFGPARDDAHFLLATWYEDAEQFGPASEEFRAAIRLNPKNQDALYELALLELTRGHRAEADRAYEQLKPLNKGLALKLRRILELSKAGSVGTPR